MKWVVEIDTTLHIGEVAFSYYQVQRSTPKEEDFQEWIESLQEPSKSLFLSKGLEHARTLPAFLHFFAQIRDREMKEYMEARLTKHEYLLWLTHRHRPSE